MTAPIEPGSRLAAMGNQLIEIHLWLREELAGFRENVDAYLAGGEPEPRAPLPEPSTPGVPRLAAHCMAFCSALRRHHTGEDTGAFAVLADRFPRLSPVIAELQRDHRTVSDILRRMEEVLGPVRSGPGGTGPAEARRVRAELDGLAALLESHFAYEEKRLVAALNALDARAGSVENLFGIEVPPG